MTASIDTREAWLTEAAAIILDGIIMPQVYHANLTRPPVRITVGWPKGSRGGKKAIGQCFVRAASTDGVNEIFISPEIDQPLTILPVLVHELIHALLDCTDGHRGRFATYAKACGLTGPMTATVAGVHLSAQLAELADALGAFPHARMDVDGHRKIAGTRQLKVSCGHCGFVARTSLLQMSRWADSERSCPVCRETDLRFPGAL
jgi:hypothetical protein